MRILLVLFPLGAAPAWAESPPPASPAGRAAAAAEKRAALDRALTGLKITASDAEAATLAAHVQKLWLEAGSPAVTLLMVRGLRALKAGANDDALQDFGAALVLEPDLAEAWHQIATARFAQGDFAGAMVAVQETLTREPRHFAALETLSRIAEARRDWRGAYAAWQKALEIAPRLEGGETRLKDLKRRAFGDET
jgi:tetratricopeptide (TPR) repeat protein